MATPDPVFDDDAFDRERAKWGAEMPTLEDDTEPTLHEIEQAAERMMRHLFGPDDKDSRTYLRLAITLTVHAMDARGELRCAPALICTPLPPRRRPVLSAEQREFRDAMFEKDDGEKAYWPLMHVGIGTFEQAAAMTESDLLRVAKVGPVRVAIIRRVLAAHGYALREAAS
jgi:hypothetical protein